MAIWGPGRDPLLALVPGEWVEELGLTDSSSRGCRLWKLLVICNSMTKIKGSNSHNSAWCCNRSLYRYAERRQETVNGGVVPNTFSEESKPHFHPGEQLIARPRCFKPSLAPQDWWTFMRLCGSMDENIMTTWNRQVGLLSGSWPILTSPP